MHFCVIKSRTIKICLIMIVVAVLLSVSINGATSAQVFFGYAPRKVPIYNVDTSEKQVAIFFVKFSIFFQKNFSGAWRVFYHNISAQGSNGVRGAKHGVCPYCAVFAINSAYACGFLLAFVNARLQCALCLHIELRERAEQKF